MKPVMTATTPLMLMTPTIELNCLAPKCVSIYALRLAIKYQMIIESINLTVDQLLLSS